jgi:putative alpha-1,2-mannosidase
MSAWYVLSSMGIYQVTPGAQIETTFPNFDKIKVNFKTELQNNFKTVRSN